MPFSPSGCGQDSLAQTEKAQGDHGGPWPSPCPLFINARTADDASVFENRDGQRAGPAGAFPESRARGALGARLWRGEGLCAPSRGQAGFLAGAPRQAGDLLTTGPTALPSPPEPRHDIGGGGGGGGCD